MLEGAIRPMVGCLYPSTSGTRMYVFFDKGVYTRPGILSLNEFECPILTEVPRQWVVMLVLQDLELKVTYIRDVYTTVQM